MDGNAYIGDHDNDGRDELEEENIDKEKDLEDDDDHGGNGVKKIGHDDYEYGDMDDEDDDDGDAQWHLKKREIKTLLPSYEFVRGVHPPLSVASSPPKLTYGERNPLTDWTKHETFILLDAWGDRFLKRGRKSLFSEEWPEVAEKVNLETKVGRTDIQCRSRLDSLKKKYRKEKMKIGEPVASANIWVYFKKMDLLLSSHPQQSSVACGMGSKEYTYEPKSFFGTGKWSGQDER